MAITAEEMMALQPGDTVRVISVEEYLSRRDLSLFRCNWGSTMTEYCGQELTVRPCNRNKTMPFIYVEENSYYWLPEFIDCIVCSSSKMDAPSEESLMDLLFS